MVTCRAPSNIALIKYMGKTEGNCPCNASLSYTLHDYWTEVSLEENANADVFANANEFSEQAANRFLAHLAYIKKLFGYSGFFTVTSRNNFPHSAGIASSASSFAALTKCAAQAIGATISTEQMSEISRHGSGSSCRSFFSPWCVWDENGARKAEIKIQNLRHELILIDSTRKAVSSSEAHKAVKTSLLFAGRPQRAAQRMTNLIAALNENRWEEAYHICWEEFADMHALFATSRPHFSYIQPKTLEWLTAIDRFWRTHKDGPIVTIDAGANIHLLWREDQKQLHIPSLY
ncbi:MAG: diphosphomevalonate decarboxylase [Alphaproteobacteria bacterium]|nr:diphosphomevalonate decarboxylase [Alphaproteobacteria bacterium]